MPSRAGAQDPQASSTDTGVTWGSLEEPGLPSGDHAPRIDGDERPRTDRDQTPIQNPKLQRSRALGALQPIPWTGRCQPGVVAHTPDRRVAHIHEQHGRTLCDREPIGRHDSEPTTSDQRTLDFSTNCNNAKPLDLRVVPAIPPQ